MRQSYKPIDVLFAIFLLPSILILALLILPFYGFNFWIKEPILGLLIRTFRMKKLGAWHYCNKGDNRNWDGTKRGFLRGE